MPALQVREFPDELYSQLKSFAAQNHRSIAQQTIACVESELARQHQGNDANANDGDIEIPPNVREAPQRARFVKPWATKLQIEPEDVIQARRERRLRALEEASVVRWIGSEPSLEDAARMVREDRDGNHGHMTFGAEMVPGPEDAKLNLGQGD